MDQRLLWSYRWIFYLSKMLPYIRFIICSMLSTRWITWSLCCLKWTIFIYLKRNPFENLFIFLVCIIIIIEIKILKKSIIRSRVFLSFEYHIFSLVSLFEKKMKVWPVLLVHINKERKIIIEWLSYVTYFLRNRMKERIL